MTAELQGPTCQSVVQTSHGNTKKAKGHEDYHYYYHQQTSRIPLNMAAAAAADQLHVVTDKYTISILAIKTWQDIWARAFSDVPLRITLEYLIHSELDWLNHDFKTLISSHRLNVQWVAQEELWKHFIKANVTDRSRLLPIISRYYK